MLREIFYQQFADIKRHEWPRALLLSAFFFMVIATYWVIKPIKRGLIINHFGDEPMRLFDIAFSGAEAEQFAKVLNLIAVYLVVVLFTRLARRFARHHLVLIFASIFGVSFVLFATMISSPTDLLVWSFYVFGDMFNTVMVGLFWAFTDDIVRAGEAKRTYGIIGLGGVIGGFTGATLVSAGVQELGRAPLLLLCAVPMVVIIGIAYLVHITASREQNQNVNMPAASPSRESAALEGARIVARSRYLVSIAGIIAIYELVSNIIDFQLAATVELRITEALERDAFFALVGQVTGAGSIIVQLLLTSFILKRFGIRTALLFLPVAVLMGSVGFLIFPVLIFAGAMSVSDNALSYSINQSAKEALYVPTSRDVTYKAKAFIDMFVQRFAKVFSVALNLVFAAAFVGGVRWLSFVTLAMLGLWIYLINYASLRFKEQTSKAEEVM